jgi:hypothetical protein
MSATNRYEVEHRLLAKAFSDRSFLHHLHGEPKTAVEKFLGEKIPDGVNVKVLVEDDKTLYALLPHAGHSFMGDLNPPQQLAPDSREHFECSINSRISADPALMEQFRTDPTSLVRSMAPLGTGVTVKIAEESADTLYVVIPYYGKSTYRL